MDWSPSDQPARGEPIPPTGTMIRKYTTSVVEWPPIRVLCPFVVARFRCGGTPYPREALTGVEAACSVFSRSWRALSFFRWSPRYAPGLPTGRISRAANMGQWGSRARVNLGELPTVFGPSSAAWDTASFGAASKGILNAGSPLSHARGPRGATSEIGRTTRTPAGERQSTPSSGWSVPPQHTD